MTAIAFIFARGGSKGVPRKNVRLLAGKPLIVHSIELAKRCPSVSAVIVSTEDPEIADVASRYGATVPFIRPPELATDRAAEWLAWQHAVKYMIDAGQMRDDDLFVSLSATSPLRAVEDVEAAVKKFRSVDADAVIGVTAAHRNPYFNMVRRLPDGRVRIFAGDAAQVTRRQDAEPVFDITTVVYVVSPSFILTSSSLYSGRIYSVEIPVERALDIDTSLDWDIAEFLLTRDQSDAKL